MLADEFRQHYSQISSLEVAQPKTEHVSIVHGIPIDVVERFRIPRNVGGVGQHCRIVRRNRDRKLAARQEPTAHQVDQRLRLDVERSDHCRSTGFDCIDRP